MQAMLAGLGPAATKVDGPKLPVLDGRFTLTTDGEIVANNTDEGPQAVAGGKSLTWTINNRTQAAPMALINLGQP
jgi:FtsP/CotA-like multicopper oxidase with cupredoxin domain